MPGGFELGQLAAIGGALLGRAAEHVDLDDEVFGFRVELGRAVVAHAAERLLLVPALLFLQLLQLVLQLGQRLGVEGAQLRPRLVDGGGEILGRAGRGMRAAVREDESQSGQEAGGNRSRHGHALAYRARATKSARPSAIDQSDAADY